MTLLRRLGIALLQLICTSAVVSFIWLLALQMTLLNPSVVKGWIRDSGVYNKAIGTLVQPSVTSGSTLLTTDTTKQALANTFTPQYIQQHTEQTLDNVYDWLDGKTANLSFSIPVDAQQGTLIQQLAQNMEPAIAQLPVCTSPDQLTGQDVQCRPGDRSPSQFADELAQQAVTSSHLLAGPITSQSLAQTGTANGQTAQDQAILNQLPSYRAWLEQLVWVLPAAAALCMLVIFFISTDKLREFVRLSRHIFFSTLLTALFGWGMWYISGNLKSLPGLSTLGATDAAVSLFLPIASKALAGIGLELLLLSGIAAAVSLTGWILFDILHHRQKRSLTETQLLASPQAEPDGHIMPQDDQEKRG